MRSVSAPVYVCTDVPLDLAGVESVRAGLHAAFLEADSEVTLDLSGSDFVDVIGYHLLCEAVSCAKRRHLSFRIDGARPQLVRLIWLLDRTLGGDVQAHLVAAPVSAESRRRARTDDPQPLTLRTPSMTSGS